MPDPFTLITIIGPIVRPDGQPASGTLTATLDRVLTNVVTGAVQDRAPAGAVVGEAGALFAADWSNGAWVVRDPAAAWRVPATNDPTTAPAGATYTVEAQVDGTHFAIEGVVLDAGTPTVRLADLVSLTEGAGGGGRGVAALVGGPGITVDRATGTVTVALDLADATPGQVQTPDGAGGVEWVDQTGGTPTGAAGGVLSGTYPDPSFAADMATQGELDAVSDALAQESLDRAGADSAHATLTTAAHGGLVASTDSRLSDPRTPTAHAPSHASAGSDPMTPAAIGAATSGHAHAHSALSGVSADQHHAQSHTHNADGSGTVPYAALAGLPTIPALSSSTPLVESGSGAAGTAATASRGDHVHPAAGGGGGGGLITAVSPDFTVFAGTLRRAWGLPSLNTAFLGAWEADTLVATNGDLIASVGDWSGATGAATASGTPRPTYRPAGLAGWPSLEFAGGQYLTTPSLTIPGTFTVFVVYTCSSVGIFYEQSPNAGSNDGMYCYGDTGSTIRVSRGGTFNSRNLASNWGLASSPTLLMHRYDGTNAGHQLWLNNVQQTLSDSNTDTPAGNAIDALYLGARSGGGLGITGQVAGWFLWGRALSLAEANYVARQLNFKYLLY